MAAPSIVRDDSYVRLHYVRYADDFVIGVEGSFQLSNQILSEVQTFVEETLALNFNPEKTSITNYSTHSVKFLGYEIIAPHMKGIEKAIETVTLNGRTISRRKKIRVRINMDLNKVLKKLNTKGIIRKGTSHKEHFAKVYRGRFLGSLMNLDHADIILYYNSVIRGIHNYYDFVGNRNNLL